MSDTYIVFRGACIAVEVACALAVIAAGILESIGVRIASESVSPVVIVLAIALLAAGAHEWARFLRALEGGDD